MARKKVSDDVITESDKQKLEKKVKTTRATASKVSRTARAEKINNSKAALNKATEVEEIPEPIAYVSRKENKKINSNVIVACVLSLVVIIAIVVAILVSKKSIKKGTPAEDIINSVQSVEDLNKIANVQMNEPEGAEEVKYSIENDKVAKMEYKKKASDGSMMNYILRSSSSQEDNLSGLKNDWGTPILMTTICKDGSEVQVISYVATDESGIMKADWYDNDKYYSMTTNNLVSREDFLQEVNRYIIANHVEF